MISVLRHRYVWLIAGIFLLRASAAFACIIQCEKPEDLKEQAKIVVQALVLKAEEPRHTFRSNVYTYKVAIQFVEQGSLALNEVEFTYEDLLMHRRGDITVCPLKHGSGVEHALKPNGLYRLYLRSAEDKEVLLAEEIRAQTPSTLTFLGTIKEIKASPLKPPYRADWVVTFLVDKVTEGSFPKDTFSIRVHSPAKSGLGVGKQYSVQGKWNGAGYDVDEFQWRKR